MRHQIVVAKKLSLTSEADTTVSENDTSANIATPALSSSSLSPAMPAGELDIPFTPACGFGFATGSPLSHSPTSRSYLPANQAKEIVRRLQEMGQSGSDDFLRAMDVGASLRCEIEEEEMVLPLVRPLRLRSRRMSASSAYYSARSRPSTGCSRFDTLAVDEDGAAEAAWLSAVAEAPEMRLSAASPMDGTEDSGVFVTGVLHSFP